MTTKLKSLESVKAFAIIRLSHAIYMMHKEKTMVELAKQCKVSANILSGIKNESIKSISLQRLLVIARKLGVEYTLSVSYRGGVEYYSFEMQGYGHFGRSDRSTVDVKRPKSLVVDKVDYSKLNRVVPWPSN